MALDQPIVEYIKKHQDLDLTELTKDVRGRFGVMVSVSAVRSVLDTTERYDNLSKARGKAASGASDKIGLQEDAITELRSLAFDPNLDLKIRIDLFKELRQWTQQSIDASGLYDEKNNALFVMSWEGEPSGTVGAES